MNDIPCFLNARRYLNFEATKYLGILAISYHYCPLYTNDFKASEPMRPLRLRTRGSQQFLL